MLKALPFSFIHNQLYKQGPYQTLRWYLQQDHIPIVLQEMHQVMGGGHFFVDINIKKIVDAKYQWPALQKDVLQHCQFNDDCQRTKNLTTMNMATLVITLPIKPFMKWGLVVCMHVIRILESFANKPFIASLCHD